ncbi:MAG: hypothetical protein ACXV3S_11205 [Kineosporiaceae bacterium]
MRARTALTTLGVLAATAAGALGIVVAAAPPPWSGVLSPALVVQPDGSPEPTGDGSGGGDTTRDTGPETTSSEDRPAPMDAPATTDRPPATDQPVTTQTADGASPATVQPPPITGVTNDPEPSEREASPDHTRPPQSAPSPHER